MILDGNVSVAFWCPHIEFLVKTFESEMYLNKKSNHVSFKQTRKEQRGLSRSHSPSTPPIHQHSANQILTCQSRCSNPMYSDVLLTDVVELFENVFYTACSSDWDCVVSLHVRPIVNVTPSIHEPSSQVKRNLPMIGFESHFIEEE